MILNFLATNWQALLSIASAILAVAVSIAHVAHKDAVADKIQSIEDTLNSVVKK